MVAYHLKAMKYEMSSYYEFSLTVKETKSPKGLSLGHNASQGFPPGSEHMES